VLLGGAAAIAAVGLATALSQAASAGGGAVAVAGVAGVGPAGIALATAAFVLVLAAGPAILGGGPRRVVAMILAVQATVLLRTALGGPQSVLEQLVISALMVAVATGVALLAAPVARRERTT
jgi:hypothetical protein